MKDSELIKLKAGDTISVRPAFGNRPAIEVAVIEVVDDRKGLLVIYQAGVDKTHNSWAYGHQVDSVVSKAEAAA